jgi:small subunit ribosomal protein S3
MGQKVNPIGMRIGVIRDWESRWYAEKEYGNLLIEDIKIREFLEKECKDAYISRIEIERSKNRVKIIVRTARPGALVGTNGKRMEDLKKKVTKLTCDKQVTFTVLEVANPDLDARLVARRIAEQLENRQSFRVTQKKAIQQTMRSGAKGIKTLVSGRLGGAEMARSEGYAEGVVPLHTLRSDIDYAWVEANTTYGKLGVKVWICRGEVLPGNMVTEPEAPKQQPRKRRPVRRNDRNKNSSNSSNTRTNQATAVKKEAKPATAKPVVTEGGN